MSYHILKSYDDGEELWLIVDSNGSVESAWDSEEEAHEELRSLRRYGEDMVDYLRRSTRGMSEEDADTY